MGFCGPELPALRGIYFLSIATTGLPQLAAGALGKFFVYCSHISLLTFMRSIDRPTFHRHFALPLLQFSIMIETVHEKGKNGEAI